MPDEAGLLAAIYADPDDLASRAVYGDLLADRGDPRGELIALQLARRTAPPSAAAERRERELLRAHHEAWTGALAYWFEPTGRVFRDGMFAGGTLRRMDPSTSLDHLVRDPMWRLVRMLEVTEQHPDPLVLGLVDRPELVALRELRGLGAACAAAIAAGRERPLIALGWRPGLEPIPEALATAAALPALRELAPMLPHGQHHAAWFGAAPVLERVHRVVLRPHGQLTATIEALAARAGALREVQLVPSWLSPLPTDEGWHVVIARDLAPGPFTLIRARHRTTTTTHAASSFTSGLPILGQVPTAPVRELVIEADRMPLLNGTERAQVIAIAESFTAATKRVPWDNALEPAPTGLALQIRLEGDGLLAPATISALWPILSHQLGQRYATLRTNSNAAQRPLRKDALATVTTWAAKPSTTRIVLESDHRGASASLERGSGVINSFVVPLRDRSLDDFVAAFARLVALGAFRRGRCGVDFVDPNAGAFAIPEYDKVPDAGWLVVFGAEFQPVLPIDAVARLASHPLLDGLTATAAGSHLVVRLSPSPEELSAERLHAAARGLHAIMTPLTIRRLGFDVRARAEVALVGAAALVGLEAAADPERPLSHRFVDRAHPSRQLHVAIEHVLTAPALSCALRIVRDERIVASRPLVDPGARIDQLANVARRLAAEAAAWFAAND